MTKTTKRTIVRGHHAAAFVSASTLPLRSNYSNDAGQGSATFAEDGLRWRRALLGGVAAGAMWAALPRQASAVNSLPANCTAGAVAGVLDCSGDQSNGLQVTPPNIYSNVNVNTLTANITPATGVIGIDFKSDTFAFLNSNIGPYKITVVGDGAQGIKVRAPDGTTIVHSGDISTSGNNASGIYAYSYNGPVTVNSHANITTKGDGSNGIDAQSGYAGVTVVSTGNIIVTGEASTGIVASGHDEGSGDREAVSVTSHGNITATGKYSRGIDASNGDGDTTVTSAGNITTGNRGTGINAGSSNYGVTSVTSVGDISVGAESVAVRASSRGGRVTVTSTGDITGGANSSGIVVDTGYGKYSPPPLIENAKPFASGGDIAITSVGNITLTGENSGRNFFFGNGAIIAFGGKITIQSTGDIAVSGESRAGIVAFGYSYSHCGYQSGCRVAPAGVSIVSTGNVTTTGNDAPAIVGVSFNDKVTVTSTGDVTTKGDNSVAIGGYSFRGDTSVTSKGNITTSGRDSTGVEAAGNNVTVNNTGSIRTTGEAADGIRVQNRTGYGHVAVNTTGDISASGLGSSGIQVQGGETSEVNVLAGTVTGGGKSKYGEGAAIRFNGGRDNTLNNHGTVAAGSSGWAVTGGFGRDTINNAGTITGSVDLVNFGSTNTNAAKQDQTHSIAAEAANDFANMKGATFNSGAKVDLGTGTLTNDGELNPGGNKHVDTTSLFGNLVQGVKGLLGIDINHAGNTSDRINVAESQNRVMYKSGPSGTAELSGTVAARLLNFSTLKADKNFTILSASGGVTHAGLTVADTALVDYSLIYPNAHDVVLAMNVSFRAKGLTDNQAAVVDYFGRGIGQTVSSDLNAVYLALLNAPDADAVGAIADQLNNDSGGSAASGALQTGDALATSLRSCPVAEGPYGQLRETSCVWAKPTVRRFTQGSDVDTASIHDRTSGISGGFQAAVAPDLWAGLGVSFEDSNTEINTTTHSDGTWWQIGGVAKWVQGPWKLSQSVSAGQGDLDVERGISIPGFSAVASSSNDVDLVTSLSRLAYSFGATGFYVTPMIDFGVSYINVGNYTETGAGFLNLEVFGSDQWIVSGGPAVEIGSTITADGLTYRPYVKAGVTFLSDDNFLTSARFAGSSLAPFTIKSNFDNVYADFTAGIQMFGGNGLNLRLNYDGHYGENSREHGLDAKLTINY